MIPRNKSISLLLIIFLLIASAATGQELDEKTAIQAKIPKIWQTFSLSDVRILPGSPFYTSMKMDEKYLKGMDVNRMLNGSLRHAGLQTLDGEYPGSSQPPDTRPGYVNHYLSAISLMYAQTGDEEYKKRVSIIVDAFDRIKKALESQDKGHQFLFNSNALENLHQLEQGKITLAGPDETEYPWGGMGNFWYGVHKRLAGLRDAYIYTGNTEAFDLWKNESDFITDLALHTNPDLFDDMLDIEHGGMNEVFADLYELTGNEQYMDVSLMFNHQKVILNTALNNDVLYGRHVNMQVPTFVGTARQYQLTGNEISQKATDNFLDMIYSSQMSAIGGSGRYERYLPAGQISKSLGFTADETCATYNMLKVALEAFKYNGELRHMDYYERALYNHILASQDLDSGGFMYYASLMPGGFKSFSNGYDLKGIWCCVGTGMENHGKYGRAIYFRHENDLLVNLFIPSSLHWEEKDLEVRLDTRFPESDTVELEIVKAGRFDGTLSFRHPQWEKEGIKVWLNEESVDVADTDSLISMKRNWSTGDRIKIVFPQSFRFEEANDDPHLKALMKGPLVMAATMGTNGMPGSNHVRAAMHYNNWIPSRNDVPVLVADLDDPDDWLDPGKMGSLSYQTKKVGMLEGKKTEVNFLPYYMIRNQRYSVYLKTYSPEEYKKRKEHVGDEVLPGDADSEKGHDFQGELTDTIRYKDGRHFWENNRIGREAHPNGWFSYVMNLPAGEKLFLTVTFWGSASKDRELEIWVEGQRIDTNILYDKHPITYYEETYEIPEELTRNKKKVTVTFRSTAGTQGGAVYGVKVSKDPDEFPGYSFY